MRYPAQTNGCQLPTQECPTRAVAHLSSRYRRQPLLNSSLATYIFRMRETLRDGMEYPRPKRVSLATTQKSLPATASTVLEAVKPGHSEVTDNMRYVKCQNVWASPGTTSGAKCQQSQSNSPHRAAAQSCTDEQPKWTAQAIPPARAQTPSGTTSRKRGAGVVAHGPARPKRTRHCSGMAESGAAAVQTRSKRPPQARRPVQPAPAPRDRRAQSPSLRRGCARQAVR